MKVFNLHRGHRVGILSLAPKRRSGLDLPTHGWRLELMKSALIGGMSEDEAILLGEISVVIAQVEVDHLVGDGHASLPV